METTVMSYLIVVVSGPRMLLLRWSWAAMLQLEMRVLAADESRVVELKRRACQVGCLVFGLLSRFDVVGLAMEAERLVGIVLELSIEHRVWVLEVFAFA